MPLRSRALPLGGRGPGEHETRSLSDAVAVGAHPAVRQVHQALHDEEAESGAIVGAAAPGMQSREALEEPSALAAAKADPGIAHRELDLTVLRTRAQGDARSEEHTSELQSRFDLVCRLLLEKKNINYSLSCYDLTTWSRVSLQDPQPPR